MQRDSTAYMNERFVMTMFLLHLVDLVVKNVITQIHVALTQHQ